MAGVENARQKRMPSAFPANVRSGFALDNAEKQID